MELVFHGGKCCGIKTIYGFSCPPDHNLPARQKTVHENEDQHGRHVRSNLSFFAEEAPVETGAARLDRLLAYADEYRPSGIIEAVLAQHPSHDDPANTNKYGMAQKDIWEETLLSRGFFLVNHNKNSNTGNTCYVYHRNSTDKKPKKEEVSLRSAPAAVATQAEPASPDDFTYLAEGGR